MPGTIGKVFGATASTLAFESKQPTGLKGIAPHLDVSLTGHDGCVGIESKFLEMYSPSANRFASTYFSHERLWDGLESSRELARRIVDGDMHFRWLHAAQLLKHAIGLMKNQGPGFRLTLLWYRLECDEADEIEAEIGKFTRAVSSDFHFTSMTYQELVRRLKNTKEPAPGYFNYLEDRYLLDTKWKRVLPLLELSAESRVNQRSSLDQAIRKIDIGRLTTAYARTVANAPQRPLSRKPFVTGHDGGGDASSTTSEKVVAKALHNEQVTLILADKQVRLVDYEVPLRAQRSDSGVGEVDLLGLEESTNRPWIIELKVAPNSETPLKALFQALRYSAIVDANRRAFEDELIEYFGGTSIAWPAGIAVAADHRYWDRLARTRASGQWQAALTGIALSVQRALGIEVSFVDLGVMEVEVVEGLARFKSRFAPVRPALQVD